MKHFYVLALLTALIICIAPASAAATLYVDASSGACGGNTPCYTHPQDAVNNAAAGDTIKVYPGTYVERIYTTPKPPHWGLGDQYAPALIVFKDDLTIEAVDPDPANTIIRTNYNFWVNKATTPCTATSCAGGSIERSTGCTWDAAAKKWLDDPATPGDCVRPTFGTAPFGVAIIASGVTIRGFTIDTNVDPSKDNAPAVFIGGLYGGDLGHLGAQGNTVENNVFPDVFQAVFVWHSSNNKIVSNKINDASWDCSIQQYDGYTNEDASATPQSANNRISGNTIVDNSGICLGAWGPSNDGFDTVVDIDGSTVCCNTLGTDGFVKFEFADGPALSGCNVPSKLILNTDQSGNPTTSKILQIDGVTYTGPTTLPLPPSGPVAVTLTATVQYQGSIDVDGSGILVEFTVDGKTYTATTVAGGTATALTDPLPAGHYDVDTKVAVCDGCCVVTDKDPLDIVKTSLIVKKIVKNDNGRSLKVENFKFSVNGDTPQFFEPDGQNDLTVYAGTYTVTEPAVAGYTTTYSNCADLLIPIGGTATCTVTNDDKPCPTKPCAKLSACPTCGTKPLKVKFTDSSTGISPGGSWKLDFGDGSDPVTIRDPSTNVYYHTYLKAGTYYAKLTVKNACGLGTTSTVTIAVKCPSLSASLSATPTYGRSPLTVTFTDKSVGYDTWTMDFGDGSEKITTRTPLFTHIYTGAKTYYAKLTVKNECGGSQSTTKTINVRP